VGSARGLVKVAPIDHRAIARQSTLADRLLVRRLKGLMLPNNCRPLGGQKGRSDVLAAIRQRDARGSAPLRVRTNLLFTALVAASTPWVSRFVLAPPWSATRTTWTRLIARLAGIGILRTRILRAGLLRIRHGFLRMGSANGSPRVD